MNTRDQHLIRQGRTEEIIRQRFAHFTDTELDTLAAEAERAERQAHSIYIAARLMKLIRQEDDLARQRPADSLPSEPRTPA